MDLRRSGQFWVRGERAREGILKSRGGLVSPEERRRLRGQGGVGDDDWQLWPPPQEPRTCLRACRLQRGAGCVVVVARCGRVGGESSSGLRRRVCLERGEEEEGGGGDDGWWLWPPPQHRGSLSLLSLTLSRTSDASSPLLLSRSLSRSLSLSLSLCENCSELTVCSGVWCGLCSVSRRACEGS